MFLFVITDPDTGAEAIIGLYHDGMLRIARQILRDHHLAEDVVQNSLMQIIENFHKMDEFHSVQTKNLVFTITKNNALNERKKNSRNFRQVVSEIETEDGELPAGIEPQVEFRAFVDKYGFGEDTEEIFQQLNDIDKEILRLKFGLGLSNEEIGNLLGMEKRAVETRFYRMKTRLSKKLRGEEVGENGF